jgi:uncharacterized protein YwqG
MEELVMDKKGIEAAFDAAGLTRLKKDIDALVRSSIRLTTTAVDESKLKVGASKIGGLPDLPTGVAWPRWHDAPQSFIAQIALADAHAYDADNVLPPSGMLWFFYDAQQETYGADPADRGGWSVLFNDQFTGLQRQSAPARLPAESQFKACSISFSSEFTLSAHPEIDIAHFDWTDAEQKQYEQLLATFPTKADRAAIHNRLLGNPDTIQDDMRQQCQLVSHGVTDDSDPQAAELLKGALEWQLLLQVDSDEHAGMRWSDAGLLYYWITRANLQARHFDASWLVLQSD